MSKQALPHPVNRHARSIGLTLAIAASIAACVTMDDDEDVAEFRDGCNDDRPEEYIDQNGEEVICVYTDEPAEDDGGDDDSDPCWANPWLCSGDDWGDDDGGYDDGGYDDGGYDDGGGQVEEPPLACVAYGNTCTVTGSKCCGSNVCGYGGEREDTWCQPLEPALWVGSCVDSRAGAPVYHNGSVCLYTNAEMMNSRCSEIQNQRCVIGYGGECGGGPYTMRLSDLVQAPSDSCL